MEKEKKKRLQINKRFDGTGCLCVNEKMLLIRTECLEKALLWDWDFRKVKEVLYKLQVWFDVFNYYIYQGKLFDKGKINLANSFL